MKLNKLARKLALALFVSAASTCGIAHAQNSGALAPQLDTGASAASASSLQTPQDKIISQVKWDQKLGEQVSPDLKFRDENGKDVQIGQYFGDKPVVMMLVFYNCTMLCSEVMNGSMRLFQDSQKQLGFEIGRDFDVVTVSINPDEGPELALAKKKSYLNELPATVRPDADKGWHLLTGEKEQIKALADSIGYRYSYDPNTDTYAHPGGIVALTPQGKVSSYFYGIDFPEKDVRYGLIEASHNKIGSPLERVALFTCFHYNPEKGTYAVGVMKVLRLAGIMTVLGMIFGITLMKRYEGRAQTRRVGKNGNSETV